MTAISKRGYSAELNCEGVLWEPPEQGLTFAPLVITPFPGFSLCFKGKVEKALNNKNMNCPRQLER